MIREGWEEIGIEDPGLGTYLVQVFCDIGADLFEVVDETLDDMAEGGTIRGRGYSGGMRDSTYQFGSRDGALEFAYDAMDAEDLQPVRVVVMKSEGETIATIARWDLNSGGGYWKEVR